VIGEVERKLCGDFGWASALMEAERRIHGFD